MSTRNHRFKRSDRRTGRRQRGTKRTKIARSEGNIITRDGPRFPNDIKQIPIHNRVIRYLANTSGDTIGITPGDILRSVGYTLNASATYYPIFGSIRLRRISLYSVPSTGDFGTAASEISFSWTGIQNAPNNLITDRGTSYMPACIKVTPPLNSLASMWCSSSSDHVADNLFVITNPANTIMDIDFDFTLANGTAPSTLTLSSAATITGIALITLSNTGPAWKPDGFPYIHV